MVTDDDLMERLVLKGGSAVSMVYEIDHRRSLDLDFSMADAFDEEELPEIKQQLQTVLTATFLENGYELFDFEFKSKPKFISSDVSEFWGGYQILFKLLPTKEFAEYSNLEQQRRNAIPLGKEGSTKFAIDISSHEHCDPASTTEIDEFRLRVYTPEMIVLEKLRALCQQLPDYQTVIHANRPRPARSRDFYDIHALREQFDLDFTSPANLELLELIFEAKRVPIGLILQIRERREYYRENFEASVRDTISSQEDIKEFDDYFDGLVGTFHSIAQSMLEG